MTKILLNFLIIRMFIECQLLNIIVLYFAKINN